MKLEFDDMPEWKEWHVLGMSEFPKLEYLSIHRCPKLIVKLPQNLFSLRELSIWNVGDCRSIQTGQLVELKVVACKNLGAAIMTSLRALYIYHCRSLIAFPQGGLVAPNLKKLLLESCPNLKSLPERMHDLISSLEYLSISHCPEIETFPEGGLPFSLETLYIEYCKKLVNDRKEWHLQELPCLRKLKIFHDGSDEGSSESWELPCTIQHLELSCVKTLDNKALESLTSLEILSVRSITTIQSLLAEGVLLHLTSLRDLLIRECNQLQSLPDKGLPSSISWLYIDHCPQLKSLPEIGLPSSLSKLGISHCHQLHSLPEKGLPSSISSLSIDHCPQLQSLSEKGLPSALSTLWIYNCPQLQSLPKIGLPPSLSRLCIYECLLLKSRVEYEKRADWPSIAQTPAVLIDDELI